MRDKKKAIIYVILLLMIAGVSSLPALRSGVVKGHDVMFHFGRIQSLAEELQNGHFPVRYESNAWYGYGYVSSLFYGHTLLYIPAVLYMLGLPVYRAYNIYLILINLATVFVGHYSFLGLFKKEKLSIIAVGIYALSSYRLSNLYVRAAVGEFTAMIFIPLVIYGVYRVYTQYQSYKDCLPLVIGVSGIIQSHILTTEIVAIFVLLYALIFIKETIRRIVPLLISLFSVIGLNAFFIVPFLDAYKKMHLNINTVEQAENLQKNGLYLRQIFGVAAGGFGSNFEWSYQDEAFLNIGALLVFAMFFSVLALLIDIKNKSVNKQMLVLGAFGIIAGWLSSIYFPWQMFSGNGVVSKLMSSVQYPWRYMMIVTVTFSIVGVYGIEKCVCHAAKHKEQVAYIVVGVVLAMLSLGVTAYFDYTLVLHNPTLTNKDADANWADKLYLPKGCDSGLFVDNLEVDEIDGEIILPYINYYYLEVLDDDGNIVEHFTGENSRIALDSKTVTNPESLKVVVKEPVLWRASEIISLCTIAWMIILCTINKRKTDI